MTYDYKRLSNELLSYLYQCNWPDAKRFYALVERARAALAEPEPEGPTDEEIMELMPQQFRDDLATVSRLAAHGAGSDVGPGLFRVSLNTGALDFAHAALARWGNHPESPDSSTQPS